MGGRTKKDEMHHKCISSRWLRFKFAAYFAVTVNGIFIPFLK